MKNKLFKGLFGFLAVLFLFVVTDVYASGNYMEFLRDSEGFNSSSNAVTIGEVETPIYEAQLVWPNLAFNWSYDVNEQEFRWKASSLCELQTDDYELAQYLISEGFTLYKDSSCNERADEGDAVEEYYILSKSDAAEIVIVDQSKFGQIVPSAFWKSSEEYEHVIGKLEYLIGQSVCSAVESQAMLDSATELGVSIYEDSECSDVVSKTPTSLDKTYHVFRTFITGVQVPVTGEIPYEAGYNYSYSGDTNEYNFTEELNKYKSNQEYVIQLSLENDPTKEATTPVAGDVIGTVTISIKAR
ncbi:MAG: hypothetical protein IJO43_02105 [Bacilli bacterium]|nr:hypothetical protein [Bacilli bacterium]